MPQVASCNPFPLFPQGSLLFTLGIIFARETNCSKFELQMQINSVIHSFQGVFNGTEEHGGVDPFNSHFIRSLRDEIMSDGKAKQRTTEIN